MNTDCMFVLMVIAIGESLKEVWYFPSATKSLEYIYIKVSQVVFALLNFT